MKGTINDPNLPIETVYHRWFVLATLLPLPANERGSGASLNADELFTIYRKAPRPHEACAGDLSQVARHFSAQPTEGNPELCLYWVRKGSRPRFGVSREAGFRESATHLFALYEGRLAAHELARVPPDSFDEEREAEIGGEPVRLMKEAAASRPAPAPDVAYVERQAYPGMTMQDGAKDPDLEQFRSRAVRYDSGRVDAFVDGFGPGPVTYALVAYLSGIGVAATKAQLAPRIAAFESLTTWERANVLFRLADLAAATVRNRARGLAQLAREGER